MMLYARLRALQLAYLAPLSTKNTGRNGFGLVLGLGLGPGPGLGLGLSCTRISGRVPCESDLCIHDSPTTSPEFLR